jgi:lipoprotein-anchoring transpeptidase ErfK/SrfK
VPNVATLSELPKAVKVIVDGSDHTLSVVDASGKVVAQFPATTGSKHDPLPLGVWKVQGVARNPEFHYNPKLFWDASPGDSKAIVAAGPNNPVGLVWIALSKAHYGIHGTPEPSTIGRTLSHGCIRLTNWDAAALAQSVVTGVEVLLQE